MSSHYSKEQQIDMLEQYLIHQKSPTIASRALRSIWGTNRPVKISPKSFKTVYDNFRQFGSVFHSRTRTPNVRTPENIENVRQIAFEHAEADRNAGSRRIALQADLSHTSTWRILKKDLKLKPYHLKLVHKLNEDDFDRRVEFSELFLEQNNEDSLWKDSILWSDEAIFSLAETVNRHNCVYWDENNPNRFIEIDNLGSERVMVWAGISSNRRVGPFFFEGRVTGDSYLEMLQEKMMPIISEWDEFSNLTFQQDGAPPHYALSVREFLNNEFSNWIGRRGKIEWPPRSPDLTPPDFFLWGYLKDQVFERRPENINQLKEFIIEEFDNIPQDMIKRACQSVTERCQLCIELDGRQIKLHKVRG
jgi:hypothetical protein